MGALFPYFALLRNRADGIAATLLILLLVIASDTGAYFTGSWIGRTKLASAGEPEEDRGGRNWGSGAMRGGWIAAAAGRWWRAGASARPQDFRVAMGILAQLGDLGGLGAQTQRRGEGFGVDFPGHGGLIDRTCSIVFAVTLAYYWGR